MEELSPEGKELLSYLRRSLPLGVLEQYRQQYLAEGHLALARELEQIIAGRSAMTAEEPPWIWTSDGQAFSHRDWWLQRYHIIIDGDGLAAISHSGVTENPKMHALKDDPVIFHVTLASSIDAIKMIEDIEAYVAYRKAQ